MGRILLPHDLYCVCGQNPNQTERSFSLLAQSLGWRLEALPRTAEHGDAGGI